MILLGVQFTLTECADARYDRYLYHPGINGIYSQKCRFLLSIRIWVYLDTDTLRYTSDTCISKRYTCIIGVCSTYVCIVLYRGWVEVHTCIIHMYRMYLHCILMYPHRLHRIHVFKCIWHVSDMYPGARRGSTRIHPGYAWYAHTPLVLSLIHIWRCRRRG